MALFLIGDDLHIYLAFRGPTLQGYPKVLKELCRPALARDPEVHAGHHPASRLILMGGGSQGGGGTGEPPVALGSIGGYLASYLPLSYSP